MRADVDKKILDPWDPRRPPEESPYYEKGRPRLLRRAIEPPAGKPVIADLFSGAGGFSVGFEMAGYHSVLGLDIYGPAAKTFMGAHPGAGYILGDARLVGTSLLREALGHASPTVMTGGVPCQGFSRANRKRSDDDPRNQLFREFLRLVEPFRPPALVVENVSGMKVAASGRFVEEVKAAMGELGYEVYVNILNAADYGVPQERMRLFFVGIRKDLHGSRRFRWPAPTHPNGARLTVWDAIGDLPRLDIGERATEYATPPQNRYQQLMREGVNRLSNHEAPRHPGETVERIRNTEPGAPMYESFRQRVRLHPEKPSPTLLAGGIRPQFQFGHPTQPRGLTVRERARLQSFPDRIFFEGGVVQGRVQTGNAVPPLLAKALALAIRAALEEGFDPEAVGLRLRTPVDQPALL